MPDSPNGREYICFTYFFISVIYHSIWQIEGAKIFLN